MKGRRYIGEAHAGASRPLGMRVRLRQKGLGDARGDAKDNQETDGLRSHGGVLRFFVAAAIVTAGAGGGGGL